MNRTLSQPEESVEELAISQDHRRRLVRAFHAWTADTVVAEDLAQETLLEAWRSPRCPLGEPDLSHWLFGVARNVLLRHRQVQARHGRWHEDVPDDAAAFALASETFDLDGDLERDDIVSLLNAALARIPSESRAALLLRYVDDLPQAAVAERLGLNEKALEGKLHRGKRAMHRFLVTDGCERARSLGLIGTEDEWQRTNLLCDICGRQHLLGRWKADGGLRLDCPSCAPMNGKRMCHTDMTGNITVGLRSFGAARGRQCRHLFHWSKEGFGPFTTCANCGGRIEIDRHDDDVWLSYPEYWLRCTCCPKVHYWSPFGSTMSHPAFRSWVKRERRVAVDPSPPIIDRGGRVALHLRWRSLTSSSTFEALRDRATQRCLLIAVDGQPPRIEHPSARRDRDS